MAIIIGRGTPAKVESVKTEYGSETVVAATETKVEVKEEPEIVVPKKRGRGKRKTDGEA